MGGGQEEVNLTSKLDDDNNEKKSVLDLKTVRKCSVCMETKTIKGRKKIIMNTDIYAISTTAITFSAAPFLFQTHTLAFLPDWTSHSS